MKKIILILIAGLMVTCSSNKMMVTDNNDESYLSSYMNDLVNQGKITSNPVVVIDGFTIEDKNSNVAEIPLRKDVILKIDYLSKDSEDAKITYGAQGGNGVLLVSTKKSQKRLQEKTVSMVDSNLLYLIGDQPITKEELENIDVNDIGSIEVIKEKERVKKYTLKNYDGVVIVTMKEDSKKNK